MTKAEAVRQYFIKNPDGAIEAAEVQLGINKKTIKTYLRRDIARGLAIENSDGTYDYSLMTENKENARELQVWKREVRQSLVEQLLEANKIETDSNQIRLNAKVINQILTEI